ncbi:MAG: hypothetical protein ACFFDB_11095 [Promethearchaeota archaeon]
MEDYLTFLTKIVSLIKEDVVEYYNNSHLYLKDLISYKNINLEKLASNETEDAIESTLNIILKAIKTGLNTLGIPIRKITEIQNKYLFELTQKDLKLFNFNAYLEIYLKNYVNKMLFEILIEYLLDVNGKKLDSLRLFKLISPQLIDKLNQIKRKYIRLDKEKEFLGFPQIEEYLNISDLSIKVKTTVKKPKKIEISTMNPEKYTSTSEDDKNDKLDILKELANAKKKSLETLKSQKSEVSKSSLEQFENLISEEKEQELKQRVKQATITPKIFTESKEETFLDRFGKLSPVHPEIINKLKINTVNLLNSRVVNPDFLDLENLFYYISIIKMLGIDFPFTSIEVIEILKNYINNMIFSPSKSDSPDPISNFYGLTILTEINLIHRTNIINLLSIEDFLIGELNPFTPQKLRLNFHTLLSIKLIARSEILLVKKQDLLNRTLELNLLKLEGFIPILDLYNLVGILKILDIDDDFSQVGEFYLNELKKNLTPRGAVDDQITKSAQMLLILSLLKMKEKESLLCSRLLNYITESTNFFTLDNLDKDFNWRIDKLAYKIELRMLYWTLLALSQYSSSNFLNL